MKFIFFIITEYPGFRGSVLEEELRKCGVGYWVTGVGIDVVVVKVVDERQEECVMRVLSTADIDYVIEMEGVPRRLRVRSAITGRVKAEVEFV